MALAKVQVVVPEATDSVEESSAECDLMIAALQRELNLIKVKGNITVNYFTCVF